MHTLPRFAIRREVTMVSLGNGFFFDPERVILVRPVREMPEGSIDACAGKPPRAAVHLEGGIVVVTYLTPKVVMERIKKERGG